MFRQSNYGTNDLSYVDVQVVTQTGQILFDEILNAELYTEESDRIEAEFVVPSGFTPQDVTLRVNDVEMKLFIGVVNLGIDAAWNDYAPDTLFLTVQNTGIGSASGTVKVAKGNEVLFSQNVTVSQGEDSRIDLPLTQVCTSAYELKVTQDESTSTGYDYDNEETVLVSPVAAKKLFVSSMYLMPGRQKNVQVQAIPSGSVLPAQTFRVEKSGRYICEC